MLQENVELVRRVYDWLGRGELPLEVTHPEVRLDNIPEAPIPGPDFGHDGARRWWSDLADATPGLRFIFGGRDRRGRRPRRRGLRLAAAKPTLLDEMPSRAAIHWVRDGLLIRVAGYSTKEQALEAAGLLE